MRSAFPRRPAQWVPLLGAVAVMAALLAALIPLALAGSGSAQAVNGPLVVDKRCSPEARGGGAILYVIDISNTSGSETLTIDAVDDPRLNGDISSNFPASLAPGATASWTTVGSTSEADLPGPVTNTVTVDATGPSSGALSASDSCTTDIAAMTLTKTAEFLNGDTKFTFVITNAGSVPLQRFSVTDTVLGDLTSLFPSRLAVGESVTVMVTVSVEECSNTVHALYQSTTEYTTRVDAWADCGEGEIGFLLVRQLNPDGSPFNAAPVTFHICSDDVVAAGCDPTSATFVQSVPNPSGLIPLTPGTYTACVVEPVGFVVDPPACQAAQLQDGLTATITFITRPEDGGGEACTPGFWKNIRQRLDEWHVAGYDPSDDFSAIFGFDNAGTLGQAVRAKGGQEGKLFRFSVASLLSAGHPDVNFGLTEPEVIAMASAAWAAGDWGVFDGYFDDEECPL